jgi:polyisoprenoid-binding protein YceI
MTSTTVAVPQASTTTWKVDPAHSVAEFKVKHMMISNVKGQFTVFSGALVRDESNLGNSRIEVSIEAASIHTGDTQRDAHLKSADFFDVEKFPTLIFQSKGIRIVRDGELSVEGDLTIHGVTRRVNFAVEGPTPPSKDPWGNTRIAASASTKIGPRDWRHSRWRGGDHHSRDSVR